MVSKLTLLLHILLLDQVFSYSLISMQPFFKKLFRNSYIDRRLRPMYQQQIHNFLYIQRYSKHGHKNPFIISSTFLLTSLYCLGSDNSIECESNIDKFQDTKFYPIIKPYETSSIKVSEIHTVAYSQYGNPLGKPVLFVHGGPGGGTDDFMARYFDPKVYRIILVDQRGCGKSTPFAELEDNTTWDLVNDFELIRKKLGIKKWMLFGGSWGSCLSLTYASKHPEVVSELVLRGIFLLRQKEIDWFYQGPGANFLFPEDWSLYEQAIPQNERNDYIAAYGKRLRGELGEDEMRKAAKVWSIWEGRTSKLIQDPWEVVKGKFGDDDFSLAFARIENHYFTNKGFFPRDNYLLETEQIDKIKHIPTVIVQGRYDVVCPPISAYELKNKLSNAEIVMTLTGHSGSEKEIINELVKATEKFKYN